MTLNQIIFESIDATIMDVSELDLVSMAIIVVFTTQENESNILKMACELEGYKREI
jgi:hypothetical protein